MSVTVTPPLFQLTIGPGESWSSAIKIVNNNPNDITYYAEVMNFQADGETGRGKVTPVVDQTPEDLPYSLAGWITLPERSVTVSAGKSAELPFHIKLPTDASPGGHYAAILVGTQPPEREGGNVVRVSSYVTSLIFVRIKGDASEQGRIREFITDRNWYETPAAKFSLRFENTGNTHLQPQGDIKIFNMWGKERGKLLINQKSNFGNVLPQSIRKFEFSWEGEESPFDIGRYSAVVTLGYGQSGKQYTYATTYFYVVPIVPVAATLGTIILFALFIVWSIRRYVRRALALERRLQPAHAVSAEPIPHSKVETLMQPIREGVIDLRAVTSKAQQPPKAPNVLPTEEGMTASGFIVKYKMFFLFVAVIIAAAAGAWWYFNRALTPERTFKITDVVIQEEAVLRTE